MLCRVTTRQYAFDVPYLNAAGSDALRHCLRASSSQASRYLIDPRSYRYVGLPFRAVIGCFGRSTKTQRPGSWGGGFPSARNGCASAAPEEDLYTAILPRSALAAGR